MAANAGRDKKIEKSTYYDKLNILSTSIDHIKDLVKTNIKNTLLCWKAGKYIEKQTFHIIGPAGVGKTQICKQITDELLAETKLKFQNIIIKGPVISRDDLLCPFPEIKGDTRKFSMLFSDFIPVEKDSFGLFVIDEFGRADHNLQQLLWQIQNENKVHTLDFPRGWFVICLDNPDDEEYSMNILEDAAGLRRSTHIYCEVSNKAFIKYAKSQDFHESTINFIETNPRTLYDFESQRLGRVFSNPASWERVSNIMWGYEHGKGITNNLNEIEIVISGLLNTSTARMFVDYVRNSNNEVKPEDIFNDYKDKTKNRIDKLISESNNSKLGKIMNSFITYLLTTKPKYEVSNLQNIADFLKDMPKDIGTMLITIVSEEKQNNKDLNGYVYISNMISCLYQFPEFKSFYLSMQASGNKAREERK